MAGITWPRKPESDEKV